MKVPQFTIAIFVGKENTKIVHSKEFITVNKEDLCDKCFYNCTPREKRDCPEYNMAEHDDNSYW